MSARHYRRVAAIALVTTVGLGLAACGSSNKNNSASASGGKTTIIVDCAPQKTDNGGKTLAQWNTDIANFEKLHSDVQIKSISVGAQCDVPADFTARLQGGTQADVFYGYMTDLEQVLDADQATDITSYVSDSTVPGWSQITDSAKKAFTENGKVYAVPFYAYTMGLVYNKKLFQQAGLDHAAGDLAGRRGRRQEDRRAEQRRGRFPGLQLGQHRWLALHRRALLARRRRRLGRRQDGRRSTRPRARPCCSSCTTCGSTTTASARSSCSAGPTC